jgi:hypothetical protein
MMFCTLGLLLFCEKWVVGHEVIPCSSSVHQRLIKQRQLAVSSDSQDVFTRQTIAVSKGARTGQGRSFSETSSISDLKIKVCVNKVGKSKSFYYTLYPFSVGSTVCPGAFM